MSRERYYIVNLCEGCYKRGSLHNGYNLWMFIRQDLVKSGEVRRLAGQIRLPKGIIFSK